MFRKIQEIIPQNFCSDQREHIKKLMYKEDATLDGD